MAFPGATAKKIAVAAAGNRADGATAIFYFDVRALISHEESPFKIAPDAIYGVTRAAYITRARECIAAHSM